MSKPSVIVLGSTGLIGSAICACLSYEGCDVLSVNSRNYDSLAGASAELLINCNGNSYRYKAGKDPRWDFDASVLSVEKSLFDFKFSRYFYFSTVDVYNDIDIPNRNDETAVIDPQTLHPYGFHKWIAERLVEKFASHSLILRCGTVLGPALKKGPLFDLLHNEPLHMSIDSELSLIDTDTLSRAVTAFALRAPVSPPRNSPGVINLTGTGRASLRGLCLASGLSWRVTNGAERTVYRYDVNNARLRQILPVRASQEIGMRFLQESLKARS